VPTPGAIANGISKVIGRQVRLLPMTAERVWDTINSQNGSGDGSANGHGDGDEGGAA
jgi:hypothetical protein